MRVQLLIDGVNRGDVEVYGAELLPYASLVATFAQIINEVYVAENPDGPDYLDVHVTAALKASARNRRAGARRTTRRAN